MVFRGRRGLTFQSWRRASLRVRIRGRERCSERGGRKSQESLFRANPEAVSLTKEISELSKLGGEAGRKFHN